MRPVWGRRLPLILGLLGLVGGCDPAEYPSDRSNRLLELESRAGDWRAYRRDGEAIVLASLLETEPCPESCGLQPFALVSATVDETWTEAVPAGTEISVLLPLGQFENDATIGHQTYILLRTLREAACGDDAQLAGFDWLSLRTDDEIEEEFERRLMGDSVYGQPVDGIGSSSVNDFVTLAVETCVADP